MGLTFENWFHLISKALDDIRSNLLKVTLRIDILRFIFCNRALRLLALFLISFSMSLSLSLFIPLWVLAIGPMLYGVPHIFASMRYFHYSVSRTSPPGPRSLQKRTFILLAAITTSVSIYRLTVTVNLFDVNVTQLSEWKGSTYIELFALLGTFLSASWLYKRSFMSHIAGLVILLPLITAYWLEPIWTIGALILIHNFVGFIFWIAAAEKRAEKAVAVLATFSVLVATGLIFAGAFDGIYGGMQPHAQLEFAKLDSSVLGRMILPWSTEPQLWYHATVAYAFGQMLHYFVWLKALGDQFHYHEMPTSFRQSFRLLQADFGRSGALHVAIFSIASVLIWVFFYYPQARLIYFCLAAFHGYLEIAGLALSIPIKAHSRLCH